MNAIFSKNIAQTKTGRAAAYYEENKILIFFNTVKIYQHSLLINSPVNIYLTCITQDEFCVAMNKTAP